MKDVMIVSISRYNRIVSVFLFVMMVFALIPSSYVRSEDSSTMHISKLDGLIEFANDINTGKIPSNTSVVLEGGLTLNDGTFSLSDEEVKYNKNKIDENNKPKQQWIPIGTLDRPYRGTFDGKGATISGLYVNDEYGNQGGLFGVLDGATVKNVTIKNSYVRTSNDNGLICGICDNKSTISECNVNSSFCVTDDDDGKCIGGVCGRCRNSSRIEKCSISGGSVKGKSFIGGIVGDCDTRSEVIDCTSSGINVSGGFGVGGICGDCHNSSKIRGSETSGNISIEFNGELSDGSSDNFSIGGICGKCYDSSKVEKCNIVNGVVNVCVKGQSAIGGIVGESGLKSEITGCSSKETNIDCKERQGEISAPYYIGGICGNAYETTIRNCILSTTDTTKYTISGKYSCIGGICGDACGKSTIINCENQGVELSGDNKSTIGGVCGYLDGAKIEQCYNKGSVDAGEDGDAGGICGASSEEGEILIAECRNEAQITGSCSGGIIGKAGKNTIVEQSYNKGGVQGKENAGGIVGEVCNGTKIKNCYNAGKVTATEEVTATGEKSAAIAGGLCGKMESGYCSLSYNIGEVFGSISGAACGKCTDSNVLYCYYDKSRLNKVEPGGAVALTSYEMSFSLDVVKKHMIGFDLHSEDELEKGVWYIKECNKDGNSETYYYPQLSVFRGKESEISLENCVIIKDLNDLQTFRNRVNGWGNDSPEPGLNGLLIADITINDTININDNGGVSGNLSVWTPIGNANNPYTGTFYGNGHTIRGLYIDGSEVEQGLFGVSSGTIKDVKMEGGYVKAKSRSGMICGYNKGGKIIGCSNSGRVVVVKGTNGSGKRSERVGGICGYNDSLNSGEKTTGGLISECCNTGNVLCEGDYSSDIGGICGRNERSDSTIRRCYNTGKIDGSKGGWDVGGICGSNYSENNKISCCYNTGTVIGTKNSTGGIVSWCNGFTENCYNAGTIKGECLQGTGSFIGGICGFKRNKPIKCCYNVGKISAVNLTNGGIGEICEICESSKYIEGGISEDCYYNSDNNNGVKYTGVISLTTREMTGIGVGRAPEFMRALNWDNWCFFADNEENQMNIGFYPHLRCFSTDPQSVVLGNHQNYMIIKNENDLRDFRDRVNAGETGLDGMLVADIDFGGSYTVDASGDPHDSDGSVPESSWTPIGTDDNPYTGTFYGNGHTIKGLYINNDSGVGQGLFGASSGTIENINMEGGYVRASNEFGMICGHNHGGVITNCSVSGCVVGVDSSQQIGGICGLNDNNGKIFDCSNKRMDGKTDEIKILSSGCLIGGICGQNDAIVMWCYNTGKIDGSKGSSNIGGICGSGKNNSQISCCYNTGTVIGVNDSTGGIVSYSYGSIENCYNIGIVINNSGHGESEHLGGVCGCKYGESIKCCYNAGEISAKNNISKGEICGAYKENVKSENCYYNSEINNGTYEDGVVPLTIREMTGIGYGRSNDTMSTLPAEFWVFKTDEKTEKSIDYYYPHLRWFSTEPQKVIGCMEIRDQNDLKAFCDRVNGLSGYSAEPWLNGILVGDIDFGGSYTLGTSGDPQDSDGISVQKSNWEPIGTDDNPYTGTFYGNGYTITGLCINNDSGVNQGLFGVSRGTIKNVKMSGGYVRAKEKVGMICGHNVGGIIENCSVSGYVVGATDSQQIGGICGQNDAIITRCYNTVAIDGSKGGSSIGGICGSGATDSKVSLCYNTGSVTGVSGGTGGIIGTSAGKTENCYNTGKISGNGNVGGICGIFSEQTGSLNCCYNVGVIEATGSNAIGAICGSIGNIQNCYYNSDTNVNTNTNGTALTTREMTGVGSERASDKMSSLSSDFWVFKSDVYTKAKSGTEENTEFTGVEGYYPHLRCFDTEPSSVQLLMKINSIDDLNSFGVRVNAGEFYLDADLMTDITFDGSSNSYTWNPIGTESVPYAGTFYGGGHIIKGLKVGEKDSEKDNVGLFGVNNGEICCLGIVEGSIQGGLSVGSICGTNNGTISRCYSASTIKNNSDKSEINGSVNGTSSVGGICGTNKGIISQCYNTSTVTSSGDNVGGIVGYQEGEKAKIENCYNTGSISGKSNKGGICGQCANGFISTCYNGGSVSNSSEAAVGGVCGNNSNSDNIASCYYNSDVCEDMKPVGKSSFSASNVALVTDEMTGIGKERANEKMSGFDAKVWFFTEDKDGMSFYPHLVAFKGSTDPRIAGMYIYDEAGLRKFAEKAVSSLKLSAIMMNDVTLPRDSTGTNWGTVIGTEDKPYAGTFDGNGHTISDLCISEEDNTLRGLFGVNGGVIKNVKVSGNVRAQQQVGMICGLNLGLITGCSSSGDVVSTLGNGNKDATGTSFCGGICGRNGVSGDEKIGVITNSSNSSTVLCKGGRVEKFGGICGVNEKNSEIRQCWNEGKIGDEKNGLLPGGICGASEVGSIVSECYNKGEIHSSIKIAGGVVGNLVGKVENCYNSGKVIVEKADDDWICIGGICAECWKENGDGIKAGCVANCYNSGVIEIKSNTDAKKCYSGAIYGYVNNDYGKADYCYFDKDSSKVTSGIGKAVEDTTVGLTTLQMTGTGANRSNDQMGRLSSDIWEFKADKVGEEVLNELVDVTRYYPNLRCFSDDDTSYKEKYFAIGSVEKLQEFITKVKSNQSLNAVLIADIDFGGRYDKDGIFATTTNSWEPIGTASPYKGVFDGNNRKILGLYIDDATNSNKGLFGQNEGTITGVKVEESYINAGENVGMICGYNNGGTIQNCSSSGNIEGTRAVGGICGIMSGTAKIVGCNNSGNITGGTDAGGICGYVVGGSANISNCYNNGAIAGYNIGGIVGDTNSNVSVCYNEGNVTSENGVAGGVCGSLRKAIMKNCYNKGEVCSKADRNVGGVCGAIGEGSELNCCYNVGGVKKGEGGKGRIGGVCGQNNAKYDKPGDANANITNCYCLENTGAVDIVVGDPVKTSGSLSEDEMTGIGTNRANNKMEGFENENDSNGKPVWFFTADEEEGETITKTYPKLVALEWPKDPMKISSYEDLVKFSELVKINPTLCAELQKDIKINEDFDNWTVNDEGDLINKNTKNSINPANKWTPMRPLPDEPKAYKGTFDGNGKKIQGLYINVSDGTKGEVGLFGHVGKTAVIKNLTIDGYINSETTSTSTSNPVQGLGSVCGLNSGKIINCKNKCIVKGSGSNCCIGGVCGINVAGEIIGCQNEGMVLGNGGVCGWNEGGIIDRSFNNGKIKGGDKATAVGGVCGYEGMGKEHSAIINCYNSGEVQGRQCIGGVCGSIGDGSTDADGSIELCYNIGRVKAIKIDTELKGIGAICGYKGEFGDKVTNIVKDCYYNSETSLVKSAIGVGVTDEGTTDSFISLTTREMTGIGLNRASDKMSLLSSDFWVFSADAPGESPKIPEQYIMYYPHLRCFNTVPPSVNYFVEISNQSELEDFRDRVNSWENGSKNGSQEPGLNGLLIADITINDTININDDGSVNGEPSVWTPIGDANNPYTGNFYGNGHTIRGLYIDSSEVEQGLFGVSSGTIKDVKMEGGYVRVKSRSGMICGHNVGGTIENCSVSGYVVEATDSQQIGGICGLNDNNGKISDCSYESEKESKILLIGQSNSVGGICGKNDAIVTGCYNTVAIDGSKDGSSIGGICGSGSEFSEVSLCYNTGLVTGKLDGTGGIIGTSAGKTENCYNTGKIGGSGNVGGICGNISGQTGSLDYCYNVGVIEAKGSTGIGAICGKNENSVKIENCYYNSDTSVNADANGTPLITREMTGVGASRSNEKMSSLSNDYWTFNVDSPTDQHIMYYPHLRCFNTPPQSAAHFIEISDKSQLEDFRDRVNKGETWLNGILVNDIKLNYSIEMSYFNSVVQTSVPDGVDEWEPIGTNDNPYTGTFYGNGHRITGLYIGDTIRDNQGLFGVNNGAIKNVIMAEGGIIARNTFGMICGHNVGGTIENCSVSGYVAGVDGSKQMGGICGFNDANGRISDCSYEGKDVELSRILLINSSNSVGGICGQNNAIITRCYNTVTVDGISKGGVNMGGICGSGSADSEVSLCYNTGLVTGTSGGTGGIIGDSAGKTENCYNTGKISGSGNVGGICGNISGQTGSLNCCYNVGVIEGKGSESKLGEICGSSIESVSNCYYNVDVGNGIPDEKSVVLTFNGITGVGKNRANEKMHALSADFWVFVPDSEKDNIITKYYPHLRCFNTNQQSQDSDKCVKIYDEVDLTLFRNGINSGNIKSTNALLMSNIMLTQEWDTMIGENKSYDGNFDGNGYIISNLTGKSLFDALGERGVIRNVGVVDGNITNDGSGMLCKTNNGTIECCYSTGEIRGGNVGGICGTNNGTIQNCYSTVDIYGNGVCGGICGTNSKIIQYCFSGGSADPGNRDAKPIVGSGSNGSNCYYNSDVWAGIEGIEIPCTTEAMTGENVADTMSNLDFCSETNPEGKWYCTANYQSSVQDLEMKYYPHLVVFKGNSDPICANVMYISSYTELKKFSDKVNVGHKYMCGVLVKDIDASGDDWTPIGKSTSEYNGRFYGTGKTISKLTYTGTDCAGLFGYCASPSISDVTLSGCTITAKDTAEGTVGHAGGICGGSSSNLTVSNVTLSGCTITAKDTAGGICGDSSSDLIVSNVTLSGCTITAEDTAGHAGGICGSCVSLSASDIVLLSNNIKTNVISVGNDGGFAGGICGKCTTNITMNRCENKDGSVEAGTAGGFCGEFSCYNDGTVNIEWCSNLSKVNGQQYAGGICGNLNGKSFQEVCTNFYIKFCYNEGNITVESSKEIIYIGGLLGRNGDFKNHSIIFGSEVTECYNRGIVSGPATATVNAGGICGMSGGTIKNCYNTGNITGTVTGTVTDSENSANVGGICGVCACEISSTYNIGIVYGKLGVKKSNCVGAICGECEVSPDFLTSYYEDDIGIIGAGGKSNEDVSKSCSLLVMTGLGKGRSSDVMSEWLSDCKWVFTSDIINDSKTGVRTLYYPHLRAFSTEPPSAKTVLISDFATLSNFHTAVSPDSKVFGYMTKDVNVDSDFNSIKKFEGRFYGNGHKITGLQNGLFTEVSGAIIQGLKLEVNVNVTDKVNTGALVGDAKNSFIHRCEIIGDASRVQNASIEDVCTGGIVGSMKGGEISVSCNKVTVEGINSVGGIVGKAEGGAVIVDTYNWGNVTGSASGVTGGIFGTLQGSYVGTSYNRGEISEGTVGGIGGKIEEANSMVEYCYYLNSKATEGVGGSGLEEDGITGTTDGNSRAIDKMVGFGFLLKNPRGVWYAIDDCDGKKTSPQFDVVEDSELVKIYTEEDLDEFIEKANEEPSTSAIVMTAIYCTTPKKPIKGEYQGEFYGASKSMKIFGLQINSPESDNVGLFECIAKDGSVKNIGLVACQVVGKDNVGSIAGKNYGAIQYCYLENFSDYIEWPDKAVAKGVIPYRRVEVDVNGASHKYYVQDMSIWNNFDHRERGESKVSGQNNVGGIVGCNYGEVSYCYNKSKVRGTGSNTGGFVGANYGNISDCYNVGRVRGNSYVGGFVGINAENTEKTKTGNISNSYSACGVLGESDVHGFCGQNTSPNSISGCYFNSDIFTSDLSDMMGLTTDQMTRVPTDGENKDMGSLLSKYWIFESKINEMQYYPHIRGIEFTNSPMKMSGDSGDSSASKEIIVNVKVDGNAYEGDENFIFYVCLCNEESEEDASYCNYSFVWNAKNPPELVLGDSLKKVKEILLASINWRYDVGGNSFDLENGTLTINLTTKNNNWLSGEDMSNENDLVIESSMM